MTFDNFISPSNSHPYHHLSIWNVQIQTILSFETPIKFRGDIKVKMKVENTRALLNNVIIHLHAWGPTYGWNIVLPIPSNIFNNSFPQEGVRVSLCHILTSVRYWILSRVRLQYSKNWSLLGIFLAFITLDGVCRMKERILFLIAVHRTWISSWE